MKAKEICLADYAVPPFLVKKVDLDVDIRKDQVTVSSRLKTMRNPKSRERNAALFLNGEAQKLLSLRVNGNLLEKRDYVLTDHSLTIKDFPDRAIVEIVSTHNPYTNTTLSGFYASGSMLSTQCEAEGFRRMTYYPDRPDVMAKFRVTIHADKKKFPVLLSNGNLTASGKEDRGRHYATWADPYPKPCYLFAMVAGKLDKRATTYKTKSGRFVRIEIYVEPGKINETGFALAAIKKAMRWDEQRFGLEYDLDRFMMVATPYFNMGAMENKGLNIFNDSCVLGRPETATDATISFIERVVGHEYFHNWTGDRITCRDWFQLSLKEGLTVFREQEFMGDMHSVAVERLDNVRDLRRRQFAEDAGAMSHPVRPERYQSIDNFYTTTVYDKGAEVVRMIQTLVGRKGFDKGMALYVKRHDGHAVTCDDFAKAMADANKIDLKRFMLWYRQGGTPVLNVSSRYDSKSKSLTLKVAQVCPPTPGQPTKCPMHIPFAVGILDKNGKAIKGTRMLSLKKARETYVFENIRSKPVLSLLRDFSAPLRLNYAYTDEELLFLLMRDRDAFSRWEAGFKLATERLLNPTIDASAFIDALGHILRDKELDASFKAEVLSLPSEGELGLALQSRGIPIDVDRLYRSRKAFVKRIAQRLKSDLFREHQRLENAVRENATDGLTMGKRRLKNLCLSYLAALAEPETLKKTYRQATTSKNMTDQIAALTILLETPSPLQRKALAKFGKKWKNAPSIMDKWLAVQASAKRRDVLKTVKRLMRHPAFMLKNPNRVSALIGSLAQNGLGFHAADGSGYRFLADFIVKIDRINPMVAASLAKNFSRWRWYSGDRQMVMRACLLSLSKRKSLSANTSEIVQKSLKE